MKIAVGSLILGLMAFTALTCNAGEDYRLQYGGTSLRLNQPRSQHHRKPRRPYQAHLYPRLIHTRLTRLPTAALRRPRPEWPPRRGSSIS